MMTTWQKIKAEMKGGPFVVTNNPSATFNNGSMSHVWITHFVQKDGDEFICFEGYRKVHDLKFYFEVPKFICPLNTQGQKD